MTILDRLNGVIANELDGGQQSTIVKALDYINDSKSEDNIDSGSTLDSAVDVFFNGPRFKPDGNEYTLTVVNNIGQAYILNVGGTDVEVPETEHDFPGTDITVVSGTWMMFPWNMGIVASLTIDDQHVPFESLPGFRPYTDYFTFAMPNTDVAMHVDIRMS